MNWNNNSNLSITFSIAFFMASPMIDTSKNKMFTASANNASFFHFSHQFLSKIKCHKNLFSTKTIFLGLLYRLQYNSLNLWYSIHNLKCAPNIWILEQTKYCTSYLNKHIGFTILADSYKFFLTQYLHNSPFHISCLTSNNSLRLSLFNLNIVYYTL